MPRRSTCLILSCVCLSALLMGCPPNEQKPFGAGPTVPIVDADGALERINGNLRRISDKLEMQAIVDFRFRDGNGQVRRFSNHEAVLRFAAPQCLRFDVRGLTGVLAQFGSNDERYWIWVEPELNTLWWGFWETAEQIDDSVMPVAPQRLLDALLLRQLPVALDDAPPELRRDRTGVRLVYTRADGSKARELMLNQQGMPYQIIERNLDGDVVMDARLGQYERIGERGPLIPRLYKVDWPATEGHMELTIRSAKFRSTLPDWFCEFPERWSGRVENLDP